uniref:Uncharacterized protein n=1 Tax=Mycena chlorophos TaxID=658473 RepID=A0ABQ0KWB7_MYCCL|nr:predicted protein [Mycena chlorophos]
MANSPLAVPVFSDAIQEVVDKELTEHNPAFGQFFTGVLYATEGPPLFVEVPVRMGLTDARSPYDLDFLWWIGMGSTMETSSLDLDTCSMSIHHWPFDDPQPLRNAYVVFCAPQTSTDFRATVATHPPNAYINNQTSLPGRGWRGNVLVLRTAANYNPQLKFQTGLSNMTEKDLYLSHAIVRCIVQEELLGRHTGPYFAT